MNRIWCKINHIFPGLWRAKQSLEQPHEKNGPVLLQNMASTAGRMWVGPPWVHKDPGSFRAATRKERPCFAAECGPDPFGHTRALQGPFSDPKTQNPDPRSPEALRKERRGPRDWHLAQAKMLFGTAKLWRAKQSLEQPHEKNGPVLLQNVASTPLGTHEHSKVHFSILRLRTQLRAATRKERSCFAAECGLGRLGHTRTLEALEQPHEKNGPVLLQNAAPTQGFRV